jgi:predicted ATPase/DNA-binding SARP family transcriptional activator
MDFRILGPLEANRDGVALATGGPKQRALLALLLLHANEPVSRDALVDGLWGEQPPETAAKALQVYVSQLRRTLGRELVLTSPSGYKLVVQPDALDLLRFEELVAEARTAAPSAAAPKLREALALWRGRALADVADAAFAQAETGRLEELRLAAAEELVDAELALGHASELVPELERVVAQNPLRERPRGQLMLALYRSGRQAEALECYQAGRRALVDELGVEPGGRLRALHQAILQQDPALDVEPAQQPEAPPVETDARPPTPDPAAREVRKTVTAVCVVLTTLSERGEALDPEKLRRLTSRAFVEIGAVVEGHGGTVETVSGDAISAVFGLPILHEDDAVRAVRAAAELRERLASLAAAIQGEVHARLAFGIGVSTGEVVSGGQAAVQLRATGAPLALSARLAQRAVPGEILVDEATLRLARDELVVETADGDSGSTLRVLRVEEGVPRHASRFSSPMVGRERERRRLNDAFEQAEGDLSCQLFTVLGPAGVGKSRLVREFLDDLPGRALVARGRCLPYGEGITFWPLLEAVKEAVGIDDADSPEQAQEKLLQVFGEADEAELLARRVAETIGLTEVSGGADERLDSVLSLLEALARSRPLVVVFDDIHWAEPTFLDLLDYVADRARGFPLLLVCLARPELLDLRSGWGGGKLNATSALLEPLSTGECATLIENHVGQAELPVEVESSIAEAAEGNPLFVEEMLSMLIDDGVLVQRDGRWIATGDLPAVRVPPTIQALLAARLDRLHPDERAVIERAAVQGKIFFDDAVADLAPEGETAPVADLLGALVRKELIRPDRPGLGGRTHRFRHLLIRDAAYDSIPKEARAETHERFARWLERAVGAGASQYDEIVGYHLEQAYNYRAELGPVDDAARGVARVAAERLGSAGRRAFIRNDAPAGVNLVSRAVALLSPDDPLRVELVPNVRVVQGAGADMTWADRVLTEAVEAAATSGDRRLAAHALVQRGLLRLFTVEDVTPEELIDAAERSISVFTDLADELGLGRAWRLKAQAYYLARQLGRCADASERALEHVRSAGDRFEEREVIQWLVIALLLGPAPAEEAEARCRQLLAETLDTPQLQAEIMGALAFLTSMLGRTDDAEALIERAWSIMDDVGDRIWIVSLWCFHIFMWHGDPITAEGQLRPGYDALKSGAKSHFSSVSHALSNAVYMQGRYEEAETLTRECEEASRSNDVHANVMWRSTRAKLFARRADFVAAEQLAREAVALAATSDFLLAHADALADLGEVLGLAGRRDEAAEAHRSAIELHERKGNVLAANQMRARLDKLSS